MLLRLLGLLPRRSDYNLRYLRQDLLAGFTVAIVALPLALAFGVSSGAGAAAGLYTAIVAGVIAALFGGSNFQVSGPTGAMTVVLLPIVADHGASALMFVGALAGVALIVLALAGVGRYVQYIPWPVVTGFTCGIAAIIFLQQFPGLLGVETPHGDSVVPVTIRTVRSYLDAPTWPPLILGLLTVAVMVVWARVKALRFLPASMAALLIATFASFLPFLAGVPRIGAIPSGLPLPMMPAIPSGEITDLVRAALAVAVLAALESLLSAAVADGMTVGSRHDPNRELFGQGLANIAAALVGGVPATAALARTAVNVRSGARTRLAAMIHGFSLLLVVLVAAPLASRIPLAVLAGILMVVAVRMVEPYALRTIVRASKSDAFVLVLTMVVTIAFDLILAIEVGLVAAAVLFIVRISRMFSVDPQSLAGIPVATTPGQLNDMEAEVSLLKEHIVVYRVDGPVFFGAANRFLDQLLKTDSSVRFVILRMKQVPVMDVTGAAALEALVDHLTRMGAGLLLAGLQEQPRQLLERSGVLDKLEAGGDHGEFATTEAAIAHARERLQRDAKPDRKLEVQGAR